MAQTDKKRVIFEKRGPPKNHCFAEKTLELFAGPNKQKFEEIEGKFSMTFLAHFFAHPSS